MSFEKLRICHVITRMIVGGAQENTFLSAAGHIRHGHDCTLVTGPSEGPEGELLLNMRKPPELEVLECPFLTREINPAKDLRAYVWLKRFFASRNYDVVHTHSSKAGIIGRAAAFSAGAPVVVHTVHGLAFHRYESCLKNFIYIHAERWAARRCDRILAVAQAMVDQCLFAKIAEREKFKVVYSGMDLEPFLRCGEIRNAARARFDIAKSTLVIGALARLFPLKGYEDFLPAAAKIARAVPDVEFLIVGDGIMKDKIACEAARLGLKFHFAGLVQPQDVPNCLAAMDLLLHLSLREGLPRAVVQALASGIPAISYNIDGAPEVIVNGKTGFLTPPRDIEAVAERAVRLLRDSALRSEMGRSGRKTVVERFDAQKMVDEIESEYARLLRERRY